MMDHRRPLFVRTSIIESHARLEGGSSSGGGDGLRMGFSDADHGPSCGVEAKASRQGDASPRTTGSSSVGTAGRQTEAAPTDTLGNGRALARCRAITTRNGQHGLSSRLLLLSFVALTAATLNTCGDGLKNG